MSGVWVFKNGVVRLVENPGAEGSNGRAGGRRRVLVHLPSGEVIVSYDILERRLGELGWERYRCDKELLRFHQLSSAHLISVPRNFSKFNSVHMYDIVVKSRNIFEVRDA